MLRCHASGRNRGGDSDGASGTQSNTTWALLCRRFQARLLRWSCQISLLWSRSSMSPSRCRPRVWRRRHCGHLKDTFATQSGADRSRPCPRLPTRISSVSRACSGTDRTCETACFCAHFARSDARGLDGWMAHRDEFTVRCAKALHLMKCPPNPFAPPSTSRRTPGPVGPCGFSKVPAHRLGQRWYWPNLLIQDHQVSFG